jgi:hypothetical protein
MSGNVKAKAHGDGLTHGKAAIAKLRLTLPPATSCGFAFALDDHMRRVAWRRVAASRPKALGMVGANTRGHRQAAHVFSAVEPMLGGTLKLALSVFFHA